MPKALISRRRALLLAAGGLAIPVLGVGQAFANPTTAATPRVYIDPGHGGSDSGAVGNGLLEKDLTLSIALQMRDHLKANWNVDIRMSRTGDTTRSLAYRSSDANSWGADLFVSVHQRLGGRGCAAERHPPRDPVGYAFGVVGDRPRQEGRQLPRPA